MNLNCEWPAEDAFRIDLQNPSQLRHLLSDIEVADELTIRYRDEMGGRRPRPLLGIQFRTRSSPRPSSEWAEQCQLRLIEAIANRHGIRPEDLVAARPLLAERGLDWPVTIPVLLLYGIVASWGLGRIRARFAEDERLARGVALFVASIAVGAAIVVAGALWSGVVEIIRVGNEHLAHRAALIAWPARAPAYFVMSVIGFWVLTFTTRPRPNLWTTVES